MKKILILILSAIMVLTLVSCSGGSAGKKANEKLTAEIFVEKYFKEIGSYQEESAGSSLKAAKAAYAALSFASDYASEIKEGKFADILLEGWNSMSEEEQSRFDANFMDIIELTSKCSKDWDSNKGAFEDSGIADNMKALLDDPAVIDAWTDLTGRTLTMGNSDADN